ncbi:hypothetical protein [uncultured Kordia sp.]|uniref:hypothetical protein n=1 Tax=uncultured Kordia sp. TaxID=507699 RepID=UPI00262F7062|nr:hypothetical protein [uncultured Kordia sp.]
MKEPIAQTLFRFISLRNPDISEENGQEKRFISPSENATKSVFYAAVEGRDENTSKWQALINAAKDFKALSKEELKAVDSKLFEFSEWLVKNRVAYKSEELISKIEGLNPLTDDTILWDNLFYQIITEKDFYAKETAIHMLKANHVLANYPKGEELSPEEIATLEKTLIYATVLLPSELFDTSDVIADAAAKNVKESYQTFPLNNDLKASIAIIELRELQTVKEEIDELHTAYQTSYDSAHTAARKTHDSNVKGLIDQYDVDVQAANTSWCDTRGDKPYDANNVDPCDQPVPVKYPQLPAFIFSFKDEIDAKEALAEMSSQTYETINKLKPIEKIKTYAEIKELLEKEEDRLNIELYQNTSFYKKSVSVNGTILPISKTITQDIGSTYQAAFCSQTRPNPKTGDQYWRFFADIASAADSIAPVSSAVTKISKPDGSLVAENNDFIIMTSGSNMIKIGLSTGLTTPIVTASTGSLRLESTVTFLDGTSVSFNGVLRPNTCGKGISDGVTNPAPIGTADENFVPKGYGMRQLGIADYRKVEQSVHCYQEGEASHIENVMAREYKEKSTRRLRINENTTSSTSETEKEQLTDTTTTNRHEMQNEVSQVLSEAKDFSASTSFSAGWKSGTGATFNLGTGANYATHSSSEDSTNQAMTEAQEITERAMDRVVQRVKEERITKIIEEYEENNKHGFDNRKGDKHVVGVYRWVDKVYKNQIYNYGRRLMYEFAIPQPSKLHRLAMTSSEDTNDTMLLEEPIDPRTIDIPGDGYGVGKITDASMINESNYRKLAAKYNAEVPAMPSNTIYVAKAVNAFKDGSGHDAIDNSIAEQLEIPENYYCTSAVVKGSLFRHGDYANATNATIAVGDDSDYVGTEQTDYNHTFSFSSKKIEENLPIAIRTRDVDALSLNVTATCHLKESAKEAWQLETFNAILTAYEDKLAEYLAQKGQEQEKADELKASNPGFYRQIEQTVLRKNCLSYLMDQTPSAKNTYGKQFYTGDAMENHEVTVAKSMDDYASFAKFMEQAFEWEIMSYHFYPFYWANRKEWNDLYTYENNDPLFRSFMQAGLARVVLTVRPGFEKAVLHYMATGSIWNGGELPILNDPLYVSIIDELDKPLGTKEGKAWKTKVPTSLTILQADSLGLKVEKALPCNCDDIEDFIESDQTECSTQILNDSTVFNDLQIENDTATLKRKIQFTFHNNSGSNYKTIAEFDEESAFPLVFRCMGQEISIQRNAAWSPENSAGIIYQKLADQVSLISGIYAKQVFDKAGNPLGLQFTVDANKIETFTFQKSTSSGANVNPISDVLIMEISSEGIIVKEPTHYTQRIEDKLNTPLVSEEANTLLPIGRFLI